MRAVAGRDRTALTWREPLVAAAAAWRTFGALLAHQETRSEAADFLPRTGPLDRSRQLVGTGRRRL